MKKVLLSTIVLIAFSCSIIIFQLSCKKIAAADQSTTTTTTQQVGKIIYGKLIAPLNSHSYYEIWSSNYDGTSQQKINIVLPTDVTIAEAPKLSPDHKTLFFGFYTYKSGSIIKSGIYACNTDGTNPHEIVSGGATDSFQLGEAY